MASATLAGSTGLVGSHILSQLLAHPSLTSIYAYTRRELPNPSASAKLLPLQSSDTAQWPSIFPRESKPNIFFSALGTTKAAAGSFDAQRKIDYDLNVDLAKAAKEAGVETYVLISAASASSTAYFAYPRMKGELEEAIKAMGFKHTVFVRPGLIQGDRTESRPAEAVIRGIAKGLRSLTPKATDFWAQDASVIGRAAIKAGVMCVEGKREGGVWVMGQSEIVELGRE
ncbi:Protein fmp52, mitochondrial [Coniothyrium glycines]